MPAGETVVVRVRGEARESVLRFSRDRPPEGSDTAKSLLDLFRVGADNNTFRRCSVGKLHANFLTLCNDMIICKYISVA